MDIKVPNEPQKVTDKKTRMEGKKELSPPVQSAEHFSRTYSHNTPKEEVLSVIQSTVSSIKTLNDYKGSSSEIFPLRLAEISSENYPRNLLPPPPNPSQGSQFRIINERQNPDDVLVQDINRKESWYVPKGVAAESVRKAALNSEGLAADFSSSIPNHNDVLQGMSKFKNNWLANDKALYYGLSDLWTEFSDKGFHTKGESPHREKFRQHFITQIRKPLIQASEHFNLPPELLATIAGIEVGGKDALKEYIYTARKIAGGQLLGDAKKTSLGPFSIQPRRAAETLGVDINHLSDSQQTKLVSDMQHPINSLYIAAAHLSDLRNKDYPNLDASKFTDEHIKMLALRYNQGPSKPLAKLKEMPWYGELAMDRLHEIRQLKLLDEKTNIPRP